MSDRNTKATGNQIRDLTITSDDLAADSVETAKILDLNVTTGKINDLAVTAGKLAADSVETAKILDLNVTTGKINDLAVTAGKLAANAVTTIKILDDNVTADKIADSAIDAAAKISDGVISEAKLDIASAPIDTYLLKWDAGAGKLNYIDPATVGDLSTVVLESEIKYNEIPSGLINGTNTVYTLANTPEIGSVCVFLNGLLKQPGGGLDYTISGSTITFVIPPDTGDVLLVCYIKSDVPLPEGFKTEWTVAGDAAARTITLPLYNSGTFNCTVNWGDGTPVSTITAYDDVDRIHTYAVDGIYEVEIEGECPAWSFSAFPADRLKISNIIYWGDSSKFGGFQYLTGGFRGCTNLQSLGTGKILAKVALINLRQIFNDCYNVSLTSIPSGIFDNCINLTIQGFEESFYNCNKITSIPTDLFRYNTLVSYGGFYGAFKNCAALIAIPTDLFRYNINVASSGGFHSTFYGCTLLSSIPVDLFRYNVLLSGYGFESTFQSCTSLTSIPTDLFRYNTLVSSDGFYQTFYNCTSLTSIPTDLFRYNTLVSADGFVGTFLNCTSLTSIPTDLFRYNTNCLSFYRTFLDCIKLQQNANIFYADGEQGTRFLNKSVNFTNCFYRDSFTGVQGVAPDLWNCNFGSGTPTKTLCWGGAGNSTTSLSNYNDIPADWKT